MELSLHPIGSERVTGAFEVRRDVPRFEFWKKHSGYSVGNGLGKVGRQGSQIRSYCNSSDDGGLEMGQRGERVDLGQSKVSMQTATDCPSYLRD